MIELTVLRPGDPPHYVTARYDDEKEHWLCEDAQFYSVLKSVRLPEDYYPDEALALVSYVAGLYSGKVKDLRNKRHYPLESGEVY